MVYVRVAEYLKTQLGLRPWQILAEFTDTEWRSLLLDAYRELVALGEFETPSEKE